MPKPLQGGKPDSHAKTETGELLYRRIACSIGALVDQGTLRPGDRVPSVRKLSHQHQVSIATAIQAYRHLENNGVIEARPQSGYYVRPRAIQLSPEPRKSSPPKAARHVSQTEFVLRVIQAAQNPRLVPLGAALPGPSLLPTAKLNRAVSSVARRFPAQSSAYDVSPGMEALRRRIALRAVEAGIIAGPDDTIITNGCQEALQLSLRAVTRRGDTIGVESPTYFGFLQLIQALGLKACELPTYPREGICLDEMVERLDCCNIKACLLMPSYQNPLGSCMPDHKKQRLVEILTDRGIPLIEDDIYGELPFNGPRPKAAKAFDRTGNVILCSSFCKTLAPGYRMGWVHPGRFREELIRMKYVSSIGTSTLLQLATADFLADGGYDHHLRRLRKTFAEQVSRVRDCIARHFPEETRISRPQGGYVIWLELPPGVDSLQIFEQALTAGIALAPGPIFSVRSEFRNCLRISCGFPWSDSIERGLVQVGRLVTDAARAAGR